MWYNVIMDKKMIILVALAIIAIMNIASFALMGHDKRCARQGKWRVPEKRLFLVTACFAALVFQGVFLCVAGDAGCGAGSGGVLVVSIRFYTRKAQRWNSMR